MLLPRNFSCLLKLAIILLVFFIMELMPISQAVRCYVCGGHSGRPCEAIREPRRRSPYVRPSPVPASDGSRQWEVCNDLINNRGCIKQVVNDVVLLRACWMQATDKCLKDGDATVCTCTQDLCNHAFSSRRQNNILLSSVLPVLISIAMMRFYNR